LAYIAWPEGGGRERDGVLYKSLHGADIKVAVIKNLPVAFRENFSKELINLPQPYKAGNTQGFARTDSEQIAYYHLPAAAGSILYIILNIYALF
jgi:hypothetical protein